MTDYNEFQDRLTKFWHFINKKASDVRSDNNTVVIIICLFVSTLFWFLKALNDEYNTEVEFPIEFSNIPKNYSLYDNPPENLMVTIEDDGFTIIRYKFSFVFSSLKFDVSKYFEQNTDEEDNGKITLSNAALQNSVSSVLLSNTKILKVYPENIVISYSKLKEKMLPIHVMADITTEAQHIVNGNIVTVPDSVLVVGSSKQLDEIKAVYTMPVRAFDLEDTLRRSVNLKSIDGLTLMQKKAKLIIPVESYTEKVLEVPIVGQNFPDSLSIRTFPGVVEVACICGLSAYRQIQPYDFKCYIDYDDVEGRNNGNVQLSIMSTSKFAQRIVLRTQSVDYLIEKKN